MPTLCDVTRHVRSKNAGPFWVTIDVFFRDQLMFDEYSEDPALSAERVGRLYGIDSALINIIRIRSLSALKISYPRPHPQGWAGERDMHSGQQFVPLLEVEVGRNT